MTQSASKSTAVPPPPALDSSSVWQYQPVAGFFDEALMDAAQPRAAWAKVAAALAGMGAAELERRWDLGRRLIHENGVTYNVYSDAGGLSRPWQLDPIPLAITAADWQAIEVAVAQRARLLNLVLADTYGAQRLLYDRHLPAELIFANDAFLRPAHGLSCPHDTWLHMYAADLARAPDGRWWVVSDRTQAPSGAGYALENRMVMTRALSDVFRDCQVTRLAEYFAQQRRMLAELSPRRHDQPRVVLLTPGPFNETYFEHAYLARYLGYTLVEPGDLTVRDSRVFLKTLNGLLPVDVILRRLDDAYCDPIELRADSLLGVPGLLQAVRSGNVAVANALGSGVVETPALLAFLPHLCRQLLDEDLRLPSVATWWCGQEPARKYVLEHLDQLVVKEAFGAGRGDPIFVEQLPAADRAQLAQRLAATPERFIAQEQVRLSTTPAWVEGALAPRHLMLRVYAVARGDGEYHVMPGGLSRISASADSLSVSMQRGGGSKDTWILSAQPVPHSTLLPPSPTAALSRQGFVLPSRVADNLYWLGRLCERIEGAVRLVRCALHRLTDESEFDDAQELPWLVDVLVDEGRMVGSIDPQRCAQELHTLGNQLLSVLFDGERPYSIRGDVQKLYRVGSMVRDRISVDAWRILSRLEAQFLLPAVRPGLRLNAALETLDDAMLTLTAFSGQTGEGMTHEKGWRFLDVGRRLERSLNLLDLLQRALGRSDSAEPQRLQSLLEIANSSMTYRSRYQSLVAAGPVLDLLVVDETNPRSLAYQAAALEQHVQHFVGETEAAQRPAEQRLVLGTLTAVRLTDIEQLASANPRGHRLALRQFTQRCRKELTALSDELTQRYLSHARSPRQLRELGGERAP